MTAPPKAPFSNIQMELLKLYSNDISDEDLLELKNVMAKFFFKKMRSSADASWEKNNLTDLVLQEVD